MAKRLKVLQLFNAPYCTPRGYDFKEEFADPENMYTEKDVFKALTANGFEVRRLGLYNDVRPLLEEIEEFQPDVIFNMVEMYHDTSQFEKNMGSLLEMLGIPYTGASADALFICNNKALAKKILRFHQISVPHFQTFYKGDKVWYPSDIKLPAIIKPLCEEASRGISQASIVESEKAFINRIRFIHDHMNHHVIVEEFIEGRELYVSIMGSKRLTVFPFREFKFGKMEEDTRIATYKAKWDDNYRDKWGIKSVFASRIPEKVEKEIAETCKRAYRALNMYSYIRFDIRLTEKGEVFIIEPNANPCIAKIDEVARAAAKAGLSYEELIRKITLMPLHYAVNREKKHKAKSVLRDHCRV